MNDTSLSLLARISQAADAHAWDQLVELYAPLLRRWLKTYQVQEADADDLVQEVLVVIARELPRFEHNRRAGAFRSWLRQIMVHKLRQFWQARDRQPTAAGSSSLLEQLQQLADETSQLSRMWDQEHDREVLARLMELLRPTFLPKTWEAFRRQMFDNQPPDEVAAALGMSLGSVYVARSRVLKALRREAAGLIEMP